jgi:nicotinamidase-related amidase
MSERIELDPRRDDTEALFTYRQRQNGFTVDASSAALVLVDLQYGSAGPDHGFNANFRALGYGDVVDAYVRRLQEVVVPNVQRLQKAFRRAGAPVIFLTVGTLTGDYTDLTPRFQRAIEYWRERGMEPPYAKPGSREMAVLDEIAPLPGEAVVQKTGASAFTASPIERVLFNYRVTQLVFGGVATNYCVQSTLRDASDRGYDCVLVEDACADVTDAIHRMGIDSSSPFCRVESAASVIGELSATKGS